MTRSGLLDKRPVYVVGIGLHPYQRASATTYVELGLTAVREALRDAGTPWTAVEGAYVGTVRIGMAAGRPMLRYLGATGIPIAQVENASASGSTAMQQAVHDVAGGFADVSLAMGVDKPDPHTWAASKTGVNGLVDELVEPFSHFALLTEGYMDASGATPAQVAKVAVKNHRNGALNPYAQRQRERSLAEVMAPPSISGMLTRLQCTPIGEGAAAVIVASEDGIAEHGIDKTRAVQVIASASRSERLAGAVDADVALTQATTSEAYEDCGVGPEDLDVVELHDAFSIEELLYVEAMGLCGQGEAVKLLEAGHFDIGGRQAVSASGGLLAMGHPTGPTGVGQIVEITRQLRHEAGSRQHPAARLGLAHMVGVGAVCVVHVLRGPS